MEAETEYRVDPNWVNEADSVYRCSCGHPLGRVLRPGTYPEYRPGKAKRLLRYVNGEPYDCLVGYCVIRCDNCGGWSEWILKPPPRLT